jgi:hypothetical protein
MDIIDFDIIDVHTTHFTNVIDFNIAQAWCPTMKDLKSKTVSLHQQECGCRLLRALAPCGIEHIDLPASAPRILGALRQLHT